MFNLLAQSEVYYETPSTESGPAAAGLALVYLLIVVVMLAATWKVYTKAGKPGWAAIVPFYNIWVLMQIIGKPPLWFFLSFVPFVNIYISIMSTVLLAKRFGKGTGFAVLLILLPFVGYPMLGFGKSTYNAADGDAQTPYAPAPDATTTSDSTTVASSDITPAPQAPVTDVPTSEPTPPTEPLGPGPSTQPVTPAQPAFPSQTPAPSAAPQQPTAPTQPVPPTTPGQTPPTPPTTPVV